MKWRGKPPRSRPTFVDILSGRPAIHDTRAAVVWDDHYLYESYRVEEPFVHAHFTNHNDFIYNDNDVEFFIAGPDAYYEFEINAFNTVYEAFFVWKDTFDRSGLAKLAKILNAPSSFPSTASSLPTTFAAAASAISITLCQA